MKDENKNSKRKKDNNDTNKVNEQALLFNFSFAPNTPPFCSVLLPVAVNYLPFSHN